MMIDQGEQKDQIVEDFVDKEGEEAHPELTNLLWNVITAISLDIINMNVQVRRRNLILQ